uniref:Transposon-like protein RIM2 n=1 Tax=Oryza sativa subsp. japonica TaxID=39947 RepID=Q8S5Z8_ORYSJ|nr:putative transposon-like protein RIM2 [Oryza sativa Japonica Group]
MDRQWMYADRRSKEFIEGVHYLLRVAEANKRNGFICCPCNKCKNQKEYSASRTIHFHLFESGFMPSYNCWTSHDEQGVEMEEDEAEDENIPDWAQYTGFEGNQTGEVDLDAGDNDAADDLRQMLQDAKEDCESEKEAHKLERMLEDHRTSLYPGCEQGHKKNKGNARMMRWHAEERQQDGMLRHPVDGSQWRNIDIKFKDFGKDARNIRFGLSPKQPGNDIDVYLRPLVEDLKLLWKKEGVPVWDEDKQEEFNLRALLFVTINDWPALSNLSGQSNKGYKACTHCMDETESTYLKHYRKVVYMGHRRFLTANHPVQKKGKHFEHKADHRTKPKHRSGKTVFAMVKDLKEFLDVRHAIDMMHLTKNLCVNLLGFLDVYGKSKDTLEARNDLKHMEQRGDLHPEPKEKGSHYLSPASYTLSKAEKESMFECFESVKVPSGYSKNIKRIISTKEKKFTNLKSHDYHVLMTQLLPVIIRGILPDNIRATITKLCAFMNAISQKVIDPDRLEALQNDVVQCLVSFELIFPPSFFNIMMHLLCHLVKEIGILGPVYLHNMFPFERYMGVLKKYVRNRALAPYIEEHLALLRARNIGKSDAWITRHHIDTFPAWLRQHLLGNETINQQLAFLARGPSGSIVTFQGYEINGYTFYTRAQDMKSTNQNSVVRIDAMGHDGTTGTYYGAIKDIWELDYGPLKVPLFRCQWVRLTGGGVTIDDSGMTTVDLNKVGYLDEPFVLANDITQVFYVKDMSSKGKKGKGSEEPKRHVVLPGKRKIVGVEDKTDEDYDQLDGQPPFTVTIDPSILLSNEDTPYSCSDRKEGTIVRRKYVRSTVTTDVLP